jgi:hypothetical protein
VAILRFRFDQSIEYQTSAAVVVVKDLSLIWSLLEALYTIYKGPQPQLSHQSGSGAMGLSQVGDSALQ